MNKPLISIGIPAYNKPKGLESTVNALLKQSFIKFEIIISNDASPNVQVDAIAKNYADKDSRVKYYIQKKNIGGFANFKFVLDKAVGKYFMWAADDDDWANDFLEYMYNELESDESIGMVFPKYKILSERDKKRTFLNHNSYLNRNHRKEFFLLLDECATHKANLLYGLWRKKIIQQIFDKAIEKGLCQKHMGNGFDNAILTLAFDFCKIKQYNKLLFFKKYHNRLIPGSLKFYISTISKNLLKFISKPRKYIKDLKDDTNQYMNTIKLIYSNDNFIVYKNTLNLKKALYIIFRHIL